MKSKTQFVMMLTMVVVLRIGGISTPDTFGKRGPVKVQLPVGAPQDIIGPTCPTASPCAK